MISSIPSVDPHRGPVDLSHAADVRDAFPLLPSGKISNLTAKRLRAEIRAQKRKEARGGPASSSRTTPPPPPETWPPEQYDDSSRVPKLREDYFEHDEGEGNWESRTCSEDHRDVEKPKIKGNKTLAEVHLGRFQSRAADGDGGKGISEWSDANKQKKSSLHSGRFQKRAGARLAGKFEPRRVYVGYGRGRGEVVPEEPNEWEEGVGKDDLSKINLPAPNADNDEISNWIADSYQETDPNFMDPETLLRFRAKQRKNIELEAKAMKERSDRLSGTVRVHADSKLPVKKAKEKHGRPKTPCWAEPEPKWLEVDKSKVKQAQKVPWGTLGNVRAVPTGAGVSARAGTSDRVVAQAAERYDILENGVSGLRVEDDEVYQQTDSSSPVRHTELVSYIGRQSHHREFREVRCVGTVDNTVTVPPPLTKSELKRKPQPKPAVFLHKSYLEIDGLPAYTADMRAKDEALLPADRNANLPKRDGVRRVKYFDHGGGGNLNVKGKKKIENKNVKWTVVEKKAPLDVKDLEHGAGGGAMAMMKPVRFTQPAVLLKGRALLEAKKRDYPYGPCTF